MGSFLGKIKGSFKKEEGGEAQDKSQTVEQAAAGTDKASNTQDSPSNDDTPPQPPKSGDSSQNATSTGETQEQGKDTSQPAQEGSGTSEDKTESQAQDPAQHDEVVDKLFPQILEKIKKELESSDTGAVGDVNRLKQIETKLNQLNDLIQEKDKVIEEYKGKITEIEERADKFNVMLYEMTTNQFNPFIDKSTPTQATTVQPEEDSKKNIESASKPEITNDQAVEDNAQKISVSDSLSGKEDALSIPKQQSHDKDNFLSNSNKLPKGSKHIVERVSVEDSLDLPDDENDEIRERISLEEVWNDPEDVRNSARLKPKMNRDDLKNMLDKFMRKHSSESSDSSDSINVPNQETPTNFPNANIDDIERRYNLIRDRLDKKDLNLPTKLKFKRIPNDIVSYKKNHKESLLQKLAKNITELENVNI